MRVLYVLCALETIATFPFPRRMIRHIITMYDLPKVLLLCDEKLSKVLSDKLSRKRSAMLVNNPQWGTENKSFLPTFYFLPEVPNFSLLQASEQLFPASEPKLEKCFLRLCIETSKAEGCSGTKVDFASQNCCSDQCLVSRCWFLLAWLLAGFVGELSPD